MFNSRVTALLALLLWPTLAAAQQPVTGVPQNAAPLFGLPAQQGGSSNPFTNVVFTGQALGPTGNCTTAPAYSFSGDENTGYSSPSADALCLVTGGTARLTLSTASLTSTVPLIAPVGAVGTPSYTFTGLTTDGLYSLGSGSIGVSSAGVNVATFGTPSGASATSNLLTINGPLTPVSATTTGVSVSVTGAGSAAFAIRGMNTSINAGYTGGASVEAYRATNASATTGAISWASATGDATASGGVSGIATGSATGYKFGVSGYAAQSSVLNIGGRFNAVSGSNSPTTNIGVVGQGLNGGTASVGVFGYLGTAAPSFGASAAGLFDNGALAANILDARDNGTSVVTITDGGNLNVIAGAVQLNGANALRVGVTTVGNVGANSCGTSPATIAGNNSAGKVTVGATAGTACRVTFSSAWTNAPACVVTNETTANLARATSTTTTADLAGTFVAGDVLAYICIGY